LKVDEEDDDINTGGDVQQDGRYDTPVSGVDEEEEEHAQTEKKQQILKHER
jgi:hypothetical protein